jgi:hypothetical protein
MRLGWQSALRGLLGASLCGALLGASAAPPADPDLAATSDASERAAAQPAAEYPEPLRAAWQRFEAPNLAHMRDWWRARAPVTASTVFYPFSGPDIANALAVFPDADSYVLFGLEPPGSIPDLHALDDETIKSGYDALAKSLSDVLQVNYFFTKAMEKKLGTGPFNSTTGLLEFFLAMSDCEVTNARTIAIGDGGVLVDGTPSARIPGVEITFRRPGGKDQTLRYFMVNVADTSLAKGSSDFLSYLDSQQRFATMIKSASYLLHKDGLAEPTHFETIRALILDHSDVVVQDDSGVPLKSFARDTWRLEFHGRYAAPTPEFRKYLQKDLRVEMQRNSTGTLPFRYGYAYRQGESNLMIAERRQ